MLPEIFKQARQAKLEAMFPDDPRWAWKREPVSKGRNEDMFPPGEFPERDAYRQEVYDKRKLAHGDPEKRRR